jgi:hypothetical protein
MYNGISDMTYGKVSSVGNTPTIERPRCADCIHHQVCYYRIEGKRPSMKKRRVEVFGGMVTIEECGHFRGP